MARKAELFRLISAVHRKRLQKLDSENEPLFPTCARSSQLPTLIKHVGTPKEMLKRNFTFISIWSFSPRRGKLNCGVRWDILNFQSGDLCFHLFAARRHGMLRGVHDLHETCYETTFLERQEFHSASIHHHPARRVWSCLLFFLSLCLIHMSLPVFHHPRTCSSRARLCFWFIVLSQYIYFEWDYVDFLVSSAARFSSSCDVFGDCFFFFLISPPYIFPSTSRVLFIHFAVLLVLFMTLESDFIHPKNPPPSLVSLIFTSKTEEKKTGR